VSAFLSWRREENLFGFRAMRNLLRNVILGMLLATLLGSSALAQGRNATVDLRKIFDGYWKTKQADAALKDRAADMDKDFKTMVADYDKAKEDYQKLVASAADQAVSSDERAKRKQAAEDKLKSIKDTEDSLTEYRRTATAKLDEQKRRMRDNILGEIRNVLNAKAKAASYTLVIDTAAESANGTPVVLYTDNSNDLTDAVLEQLNAAAPSDTGKTDATPPDTKADKKKK
jgi:outer membrane protein